VHTEAKLSYPIYFFIFFQLTLLNKHYYKNIQQMTTGKAQCVTCRKEKSTVICDGCSQRFCVNHFGDHRKELSKLFDKIEVNRDLFRQAFNEQTAKPDNHLLMKQIDQWEQESINKIKQTADEARQLLQKYTVEHLTKLEVKLNKLTSQLRESREENDYSETDIHQWTKHLTRMTTELDISSHITVKHESTSLVNKISVHLAGKHLNFSFKLREKKESESKISTQTFILL